MGGFNDLPNQVDDDEDEGIFGEESAQREDSFDIDPSGMIDEGEDPGGVFDDPSAIGESDFVITQEPETSQDDEEGIFSDPSSSVGDSVVFTDSPEGNLDGFNEQGGVFDDGASSLARGPAGPPGTPGTPGTIVVANPDVTPTDPALSSVEIAGVDYRIEGGGDGVQSVDAEFNDTSRDLTITVNNLSDTVNIPGGGTSIGLSARPIFREADADYTGVAPDQYFIDAPTGESFTDETIVFRNGVSLLETTADSMGEYTRTTTRITFTCRIRNLDEIEIHPFQPLTNIVPVNWEVVEQTISGDQPVGYQIPAINGTEFSETSIVERNGVILIEHAGDIVGEYTRTTTTITFRCPLRDGDEVSIRPSQNITPRGGAVPEPYDTTTNPTGYLQNDDFSVSTDMSTLTLPDGTTFQGGGGDPVEVETTEGSALVPLSSITFNSTGTQATFTDNAGGTRTFSGGGGSNLTINPTGILSGNLEQLSVIRDNATGIQYLTPIANLNAVVGGASSVNQGTLMFGTPFGEVFGAFLAAQDGVVATSTRVRAAVNLGEAEEFVFFSNLNRILLDNLGDVNLGTLSSSDNGMLLGYDGVNQQWIPKAPGNLAWRDDTSYVVGDAVTFLEDLWIAEGTTTAGMNPTQEPELWTSLPVRLNDFNAINTGFTIPASAGTRLMGSGGTAHGNPDTLQWRSSDSTIVIPQIFNGQEANFAWQIADLPDDSNYSLSLPDGTVVGPLTFSNARFSTLVVSGFPFVSFIVDVSGDATSRLINGNNYFVSRGFAQEFTTNNPITPEQATANNLTSEVGEVLTWTQDATDNTQYYWRQAAVLSPTTRIPASQTEAGRRAGEVYFASNGIYINDGLDWRFISEANYVDPVAAGSSGSEGASGDTRDEIE